MKYKFKLKDNSFSTINYINNSIKQDKNYINLTNSRDLFVVTTESYDFFEGLRNEMLLSAQQLGYPDMSIQRFDNNSVDCHLGITLYDYLKSKDVKIGFDLLAERVLWSNINLYLIPDIIFWRFSQGDKIVHSDRFTTHKRRNYSWYISICCYLFHDARPEEAQDPWYYLKHLGIDDKVQLIERARFGYNRIYYNQIVKKVFSYPSNKRNHLIRSLTRLVTFFQSRYSFSFVESHVDAFINFLLSQIDSIASANSDQRIGLAADSIVNYDTKFTYVKKVIHQDLDRTASISVDAASQFFSLINGITERKILVSIDQTDFYILVKKRDTRAEYRIFLGPIYRMCPFNVDDLLIFTKDPEFANFQLNISRKDSNNAIYNEYCNLLAGENHLILR
jgi:hypothetical protein